MRSPVLYSHTGPLFSIQSLRTLTYFYTGCLLFYPWHQCEYTLRLYVYVYGVWGITYFIGKKMPLATQKVDALSCKEQHKRGFHTVCELTVSSICHPAHIETMFNWCHKLGECAKSCARRPLCFCFVSIRGSYHVTEVGGPYGLWDSQPRLSCKMSGTLWV